MTRKIKRILNHYVLEIEPPWAWNDCCGNRIEIDFPLPESTIKSLQQEQEIELRYPVILENGSLQCEIFIEGENIRELY